MDTFTASLLSFIVGMVLGAIVAFLGTLNGMGKAIDKHLKGGDK